LLDEKTIYRVDELRIFIENAPINFIKNLCKLQSHVRNRVIKACIEKESNKNNRLLELNNFYGAVIVDNEAALVGGENVERIGFFSNAEFLIRFSFFGEYATRSIPEVFRDRITKSEENIEVGLQNDSTNSNESEEKNENTEECSANQNDLNDSLLDETLLNNQILDESKYILAIELNDGNDSRCIKLAISDFPITIGRNSINTANEKHYVLRFGSCNEQKILAFEGKSFISRSHLKLLEFDLNSEYLKYEITGKNGAYLKNDQLSQKGLIKLSELLENPIYLGGSRKSNGILEIRLYKYKNN